MNKKDSLIGVYNAIEPTYYLIKEFNFNPSTEQYQQDITARFQIERFDQDYSCTIIMGEEDDYILLYSAFQTKILKKEGDNWVLKSSDISIQGNSVIYSSKYGNFLSIRFSGSSDFYIFKIS